MGGCHQRPGNRSRISIAVNEAAAQRHKASAFNTPTTPSHAASPSISKTRASPPPYRALKNTTRPRHVAWGQSYPVVGPFPAHRRPKGQRREQEQHRQRQRSYQCHEQDEQRVAGHAGSLCARQQQKEVQSVVARENAYRGIATAIAANALNQIRPAITTYKQNAAPLRKLRQNRPPRSRWGRARRGG